ncbi:MAG: hypothetical protein OER90_00370 [Gemmatimonadota bacterium]|nr:hypothetical protein [Gemmatimonadota bacterium]
MNCDENHAPFVHVRQYAKTVAFAATLMASPVAALAAQQTIDPVADSLVGLWTDSVGGMRTFEALRTAEFTVTTFLYDTTTTRLKRARPRYVWLAKGSFGEATRVERWEGDDFIVQGFNGRDPAWAVMNGEWLNDSAKDASEALYVARDLFYWIGLPFKLRDPGVHLSYLGLRERPGSPWSGERDFEHRAPDGRYHAVAVSFGAGVGEHQDVFTYYFAPGSGFPLEVTYVEEGRENINRLLWGPTARSGDLAFPHVTRRDFITASGKRTKALVIENVTVNAAVLPERFERP